MDWVSSCSDVVSFVEERKMCEREMRCGWHEPVAGLRTGDLNFDAQSRERKHHKNSHQPIGSALSLTPRAMHRRNRSTLQIVLLYVLIQGHGARSDSTAFDASASIIRPPQSQPDDTLESVSLDLSRIPYCPTLLVTPTHSKRDSSYTKNWNGDDWQRHHMTPLPRYRQHVSSWIRSPTAAAVIPLMGVVAMWSALVNCLAHLLVPSLRGILKASAFSTAIASFTAPVALLLTLRTNRALDRLLEARRAWGVLIKSTTTLAGLIATYVSPRDPSAALLVARYLSILGWAFKGVFMAEDDQPVVATALPKSEADWLMSQAPTDTASVIVFRTRTAIASIPSLPTAAVQAMEARLDDIETSLGICKRILGSPLPPTFSRHTSRVLCLYLLLLPLGLVGGGVAPTAVVLQTALTAYVFSKCN